MKTREEVEALKKNWLNDSCWDLEDTEGFAEYAVELGAFAIEHEAKWRAERDKREAAAYRNTPASEATLRDMFAAHAMQGEIASTDDLWEPSNVAKRSYTIADAMMEARKS